MTKVLTSMSKSLQGWLFVEENANRGRLGTGGNTLGIAMMKFDKAWMKQALRPVPVALLLPLLWHMRSNGVNWGAANRSEALAQALGHLTSPYRPLVATAADVTWVDAPGHGKARAIVRARRGENPPQLYLVSTRLSPEGVLLDFDLPKRLTHSRGVEESQPLVHGDRVATALLVDKSAISVQLLDLRGEAEVRGPGWTWIKRMQNSLTNYQETGQLSGIGRRSFRLVPPAQQLSLQFDQGNLLIRGKNKSATVPEVLPVGQTDQSGEWVKPEPSEKGQLGNLVTWSVDRVRSMPWFGDENMQRLKAIAFGAMDAASRAKESVVPQDTESEIKNDLGQVGKEAHLVKFTDPETGWPPPAITPYFKEALQGEGEWLDRSKDPFVSHPDGASVPFGTTYIRSDRSRVHSRLYVTVWDPRLIELHMVAGTVEPKGPTGDAGPGVIPREPAVLRRVVAAFNGGFQALHGEWGMMADGMVYLPPKPYAATIARLNDGSTGFGVWPDKIDIPPNINGYRQNLTPLVMDEKLNPYNRTWWGGTPPDWEDRVHTTRSGLCMTKEGFIMYFYGNGIDAMPLGQAMVQARCTMGLHLDMNPGHTGLEFYNISPKESWAKLERPMQNDWEREGQVHGMKGMAFRSRRMIRGMGLMEFPRYIKRESRDFFYLTLRHTLPGPEVEPLVKPAEEQEGKWRVKGLPQHGFPYAMATTLLRPDSAHPQVHARVAKFDPKALRIAGAAGVDGKAPVVVAFPGAKVAREGDTALWLGEKGAVFSKDPVPGALPLLAGTKADKAPSNAKAVLGIDAGGMLVYAEFEGEDAAQKTAVLGKLLHKLGCKELLWLEHSLEPLLGGTTTLAGTPGKVPEGKVGVTLVRGQAPGVRRIFPDTPVVPFKVWQPLQKHRIRYFKKSEG
jgi:hypothetical protein